MIVAIAGLQKGIISVKDDVICKGKIKGNIMSSQKVEMSSTGKITGNVQTPALGIELGAVLTGKCNMSGGEKPVSEDGSKPNTKVVAIKEKG